MVRKTILSQRLQNVVILLTRTINNAAIKIPKYIADEAANLSLKKIYLVLENPALTDRQHCFN